jgi:hypothetical protein
MSDLPPARPPCCHFCGAEKKLRGDLTEPQLEAFRQAVADPDIRVVCEDCFRAAMYAAPENPFGEDGRPRGGPAATQVSFPDDRGGDEADFDRDSVSFPAEVAGQRVLCRVSAEALVHHFGAKSRAPGHLREAFAGNREAIRLLAKSLLESGKVCPDGELRITHYDTP